MDAGCMAARDGLVETGLDEDEDANELFLHLNVSGRHFSVRGEGRGVELG